MGRRSKSDYKDARSSFLRSVLLLNTSYEEYRMASAKSCGVSLRQMTNIVTLGLGQPAIALLRRQNDSPCRTLVVGDKDDIGRLNVATLIHADVRTVTRINTLYKRGKELAAVHKHFQQGADRFLLCAVLALHGFCASSPYRGVGVYRPFL